MVKAADEVDVDDDIKELSATQLWLGTVAEIAIASTKAVVAFYFVSFVLQVLRISPFLSSALSAAYFLSNTVATPIVGFLSDRTRTKLGRRKPWIISAAVPDALLFILLWQSPFEEQMPAFIYLLIIVVLKGISEACLGNPHSTLINEMPRVAKDLKRVQQPKVLYFYLGGLFFVAVHTLVQDNLFEDDPKSGYSILGVILGLIFMVLPWIEAAFSRSKGTKVDYMMEKKTGVKTPLLSKLWSVATKPFFITSGVSASVQCAIGAVQVYSVLFISIILKRSHHFIWLLLTSRVSSVVAVVVWSKLGVRVSARMTYIISAIVSIVGLAISQIFPADWIWAYYISVIIASFGSGGCVVASLGLAPRVLAYDRVTTGNKRGGFISSLLSLVNKFSVALMVPITNALLGVGGYDTDLSADNQPDLAKTLLRINISAVPIFFMIVSSILMFFYPISEEQFEELKRKEAELDLKDTRTLKRTVTLKSLGFKTSKENLSTDELLLIGIKSVGKGIQKLFCGKYNRVKDEESEKNLHFAQFTMKE